jgi:arsenate reductase (glutaredoxin)
MKKVYYLATCDTCKRILKELQLPSEFVKHEIKQTEIPVKELYALQKLKGSYEALFSKRAKLYKEHGLKDERLTEDDYKTFILEHYTFLKRPVVVNENEIFVGNSKKTVEAAKASIHNL